MVSFEFKHVTTLLGVYMRLVFQVLFIFSNVKQMELKDLKQRKMKIRKIYDGVYCIKI